MTIDEFLIRETNDLVLPSKTFYPLKIPIAHPQLRHFINCPDPNLIYYASGHDIYCLNTETKARTHIHHVPFDCRCTAAGYGWICVAGGDKGSFTIIQLDAVEPEESGDVDAHLPLGLNERPIGRPSPRWREPRVVTKNLGTDIINSITIHKLVAEADDTREEVVAVITSNDRTVRIYSLSLGRRVASLELPFPMNHATISPDGQLLLAVGDYNQAYFFERMRTPHENKWEPRDSKAADWEVLNIVQLHCPKDLVSVGYFATTWSPSGGLCAVGSECGYVSVFDTELIRTADWGEDAVVEVVESTRPENRAGPGAIRSMMFSPQPWDLLIWAEDRGRVVIADIRAGLKVRQVIKLDPDEPGVEKAQLQDFSLSPRPLDSTSSGHDQDEASSIQGQLRALTHQVETLRQYRMALDADVDLAAASMSTEYLELLSERRRLQRLAAAVQDDPNGLTAEERQVLDALRTGGSTTDLRRSSPLSQSTSADYDHDVQLSQPTRGTLMNAEVTSQDAEQRSTAIRAGHSPAHSEGLNHVPSLAMLQEFLRERESEPPRVAYQPRRQPSVALPGSSSRSDPSAAPGYEQTNNHGSLLEARHIIESQWARSPSALSNSTAPGRPYTPPPHMARVTNYLHINSDSRPSTSDSSNSALLGSDERTDTNNPLRRRNPALRAIEGHQQTIAQLRNTVATSSSSTTTPAGPFFGGGSPLINPASPSPSSPSSPTSATALTGARRSTLNTRPHSRMSDRLSDYEARVRYMSRFADPSALNFLQRQNGRYESPDWGDRTAGLAMSSEGGRLWCASERGVLEVDVNLWGRRVWAAEKFA